MNVDTGELKRFANGVPVENGFIKLMGDEAKEADALLAEKESMMLPPDHPLRQRVSARLASANRPSPKAKRRESRDSRKRNRK